MASYAQIAQYSFDVKREDGTTRTYQMTFSEKDGSALSLDVPHTDELVIVEGNDSDAPNKPIIVKQAQFRLKGKNSTLIDKILEAGLRDIKVKIEDTAASRELFDGYVVRAFDTYRLYEDVQEINVRAVVPFADLSSFDVEGTSAARNSLQEFFHEAFADVDLDKNVDFYTGLDHSTRDGSNGMPEEIEFDESKVAGSDGANLFDAMRGALIPFGWQLFQQNGRYIIADIYDRFANRAAITKWVDDGAGNYSSSSEDIVITLDESTVIRGGDIKQLEDVVRYDHIHNFGGRNSSNGYELFSLFTVAKGSETARVMEDGMVRENDVIEIDQSDGQLTLNADPASNLTGDFGFLRVVIEDRVSGTQYHYDPVGDTWEQGTTKYWFKDSYNFTSGGGSGQTATFEILNRDLPPVPEGVIGDVIVYQANELFPDGAQGTTEINGCEHENIDINHQTDDATETASRVYRADADPVVGQVYFGNFFLGDEDQYFDSTFWYVDGATGSRTNSWDWDGNTDTLGDAVAERVGTVVSGSGIEFKVRIRDVQNVTMLNAFEIDDNDGNTRVCLPKKIKLEASAGFYTVTLREVFDGFNQLEGELYSESYSSGVGVGSSSTVSTTSTTSAGAAAGGGGGGASDHGQLQGLGDDDHSQYMHNSNNRTVTAVHNFQNGLQVAGIQIFDTPAQAQSLGTGDDVEFNGGIFNGEVEIEGQYLRFEDDNTGGYGLRWEYQNDLRYIARWEEDVSEFRSYIYDDTGSFVAQVYSIRQSDGRFDLENSVTIDDTLTINGTPLFDLGKEQNLSDDATGVSFADLTLSSTLDVTGLATLDGGFDSNASSNATDLTLSGTLDVAGDATFSNDVFVTDNSGTEIQFEISLNVSGGGGLEMKALDSGNMQLTPIVNGTLQAEDLTYNSVTNDWEINGDRIFTAGDAQTLSYNSANNELTLSDGGGSPELDVFGNSVTFESGIVTEGRSDFKGVEQLRLYDSTSAVDYISFQGDQLIAHDDSAGAGADSVVWDIDITNGDINFSGNVTVGGVDLLDDNDIGNSVQAFDSDLQTYADNGGLTASELGQLQNINSVTISNANWGHVAALNQDLATTDSPTFGGGTFNGQVDFNNEIKADGIRVTGGNLLDFWSTAGATERTRITWDGTTFQINVDQGNNQGSSVFQIGLDGTTTDLVLDTLGNLEAGGDMIADDFVFS